MPETIGLIAGGGLLPILMAKGIRAAGDRVACVGLRGQFDPELPPLCDQFGVAGIARVGRWVRLLHRFGARRAVMVGKVRKAQMYDPWLMLHMLPDWTSFVIWYVKCRHDRRTDRFLGAIADHLASTGVSLMDSTHYIADQMAGRGVLGKRQPTAGQMADIAFALPIVARMGDLDVGQAVAIKDREVIAVEAIEGTDAMIERAGALCRSGGWFLVKAAKPGQDPRFDVPAVGTATIEHLRQAKAAGLAVEAGKVIMLDLAAVIAAADQAGLAIIGVTMDPKPGG